MGIEIAPFLGLRTWIYGLTLCLECRGLVGLAGDLPFAWRTTRLASRRHRHLPQPKQRRVHFIAFLDSVNSRKILPAMAF
jgi:hypothetical protein